MIRLGVIADDFTGASDIASFLVANGLSTIQMNGIPARPLPADTDAVVISLKSRSNPAPEAVAQSLAALDWLQQQNCAQYYFKYCSTFDSTAAGNIGPVTDALLAALQEDFTIIAPALPVNGRTVFNGYLFVGTALLNESGMENHPITPMRDANLCRLMNGQATGKTGLISYQDIARGSEAVRDRCKALRAAGYRYAVVDSIDDAQLHTVAAASADLRLITGGSGLGAALAARLSGGQTGKNAFTPTRGATVILSGSCSRMTNQQVAAYQNHAPSQFVDIARVADDGAEKSATTLSAWAKQQIAQGHAPLLYATVPPEQLHAIQTTFGAAQASALLEETFALLAAQLRVAGVQNFIIAGGETSSIVVQQLHLDGFHIGKTIAPGVPWLRALDDNLFLALKSGNFGAEDFFARAVAECSGEPR